MMKAVMLPRFGCCFAPLLRVVWMLLVSTSPIQPLPLPPSCCCECWVHWKWDMRVSTAVIDGGSEGGGGPAQKERGEAASSKLNQRREGTHNGRADDAKGPQTQAHTPWASLSLLWRCCGWLFGMPRRASRRRRLSAHMALPPAATRQHPRARSLEEKKEGGWKNAGCLPVDCVRVCG